MSLLDHPKAQALLEDATVSPGTVRVCSEHLTEYLQRYLPLFYRGEQRVLAEVVIKGKLSGLERKTSEPIAREAGRQRKPVQNFVGAGAWDDDAVLAGLRRHVAEELGDPQGVFVLDNSGFAKKGTESCGVARQWCGRLGKVDNCQVGVFLYYATAAGRGPLDCRLYLPQEWAADAPRRQKTHVPADVTFQEKWRIGLELIARSSAQVPHGWVTADDEFGRVTEFRSALRLAQEQYVLDIPCNTLVREIGAAASGRRPAFERADRWAARQPQSAWKVLTLRLGEQGPLKVRALKRRVQTKDEAGRVGPSETLLVVQTLEKESKTYYALSNAPRDEKLAVLAGVKASRHEAEVGFQEGKGEVGLAHYEVRSWRGWHHHMVLSFLALWFLTVEKRRLGKKNTGRHRSAGPPDFHAAAARAGPEPGQNRSSGQRRPAA